MEEACSSKLSLFGTKIYSSPYSPSITLAIFLSFSLSLSPSLFPLPPLLSVLLSFWSSCCNETMRTRLDGKKTSSEMLVQSVPFVRIYSISLVNFPQASPRNVLFRIVLLFFFRRVITLFVVLDRYSVELSPAASDGGCFSQFILLGMSKWQANASIFVSS